MADKGKGGVAPAVLGVAAAGMIGVGIYFWARKPGVQPGAEMVAVFNFQRKGTADNFYFQIALGHIRAGIFDEVEGLKWRVKELIEFLPDWKDCIVSVGFTLPEMMDAGEYDAEASIRDLEDKLIIRHLQNKAVIIPKS